MSDGNLVSPKMQHFRKHKKMTSFDSVDSVVTSSSAV